MNESVITSILGDQTFSKLTSAYCNLAEFLTPIAGLTNVYGKIEPADSDWGNVQLMVNYMKAEIITIASAIEP